MRGVVPCGAKSCPSSQAKPEDERDRGGGIGMQLAGKARELGRKQAGIDAVHQGATPIGARRGPMRLAPINDVVVVKVRRDRAANGQRQHFP